ncbi:MAG TPA: polysaccharide deacetylase family protein [Allosphingosinicella sp.]|nr:polysaccharide deacetylase family protein [Allosphingosinicella sp.]
MTGETQAQSPEHGRLDRPPPPGAYLDLPESFGRRFAIFVDTEEEFDWSQPTSRDRHGTSAAESLPKVHFRMREAGVKPVYLVDWPIANDIRCVPTLREFVERGECAVGTHLHPWLNPPLEEELDRANSFAGNLPEALERAKLLRLTETIENGIGRRPIVYRAGRYGVGPNTARLLAEAGYEADSSVRPLHDYSGEGGPDFTDFEPQPYRVGPLIELPLTVAYTGRLRRQGSRLYDRAGRIPRGRGLLARTGLLNRIALTPEGIPLREAMDAVEQLLDDGLRFFSISFHSPTVEPGHTPYVRDLADLDTFYRWFDGMFNLFARRAVAPAALEEIVAAARAAP